MNLFVSIMILFAVAFVAMFALRTIYKPEPIKKPEYASKPIEAILAVDTSVIYSDQPNIDVISSWSTSHHRRVGHVLELSVEGLRKHLTVVEWLTPKEQRKLAEDILEGRYDK